MPARHLRSVDFPDPFRPTIPRNSPSGTLNDTSCSTCSSSYPVRRKGWSARSLSVWTRSCGMRNDLDTPSTATVGRAASDACLIWLRFTYRLTPEGDSAGQSALRDNDCRGHAVTVATAVYPGRGHEPRCTQGLRCSSTYTGPDAWGGDRGP